MPPPKKKKCLRTRLRENRERNRRKREAETTPEREARKLENKERHRRRKEAESIKEEEIRQQENRERIQRSNKQRKEAQLIHERETRLQEDRERKQRIEDESISSLVDCETGRRPSRRAAIVASKKISNTVCSYNLKVDPDFNANANVPPKPPVKTEKAQQQKKSPTPPLSPEPPIEIGLDMECEEEILSKTQAETLSKAQSRYNLVMKGLRELVQCNVKVIQTDPFGTVILNPSTIPFQIILVKNTVIPTSIASQTISVAIRTNSLRIVELLYSQLSILSLQ